MDFVVGVKVQVNVCKSCPSVVGKTALISELLDERETSAAVLNFGRGRPQANRPKSFDLSDISLVKE